MPFGVGRLVPGTWLRELLGASGCDDTHIANVTAYALYGAVDMIPVSARCQLCFRIPLQRLEESHFTRTDAKNRLPTRLPNVTTREVVQSHRREEPSDGAPISQL